MNLMTHRVPEVLIESKKLLEAMQKEMSVNDKLFKNFNFVDLSLAESFAILEQAERAQMEYDNVTKDEAEVKASFEKQYAAARAIFRWHEAHFKVGLKCNPQKLVDLGLMGLEGKTSAEWLDNTFQVYEYLLADPETIEGLKKYYLTKLDFRRVQVVIISTRYSYEALTKGRSDIKIIIDKRDKAVLALIDKVSEIQALLLHVFENDAKKLDDYNLPVVTDEIGQQIIMTIANDSSIT